MKEKLPLVARLLLGLVFTVFGLNGFFHFIPEPELPEKAGEFLGALVGSGYFFQFLKATETVCGLLLLSGVFVPLALTVLAPVILNIFFFHAFLAPGGIALPIVLIVLEVYLAWAYRSSFASVLRARARPG